MTRLALQAHRFSYKLVSKLALLSENGVHPKHRLMNYHQFFLDHISPNNNVLDIGCGNGALAFDLAKKAFSVTAIDTNKKNQSAWEQTFHAPNLSYSITDATTFKPDRSFDVIVLSNVLEHIEKRTEFLQQIKQLAPLILIRVPMINRDWVTIYKKELGLDYRLDTTHFTEYTLESFESEITSANLRIDSYSIQFGEIWAVVKHANT